MKKEESTKVLIFSHSIGLAGAERSLLELVKELSSEHDTFCTIILPDHGPLEELLKKVGAATQVAPMRWWCTGGKIPSESEINILFSQSFGWIIDNLELLNNINPDVVITNTIVIPWGALVASLLKRPHIWMINEFGELDHGFNFYLPFQKILDIIGSSSDKILTCSKAIQNELFSNVDSNQVSTIYFYIDILDKEKSPEIPKDNYFHVPDACRLIISGTVTKSKGQEDAVRSVIELVKNRKRKVELVIIGYAQPEYIDFLQEMITNEEVGSNIHILPFQDNIFPILRSADIVLVCSKMEAFGRTTLEAMLMGKAVIATNTGGILEMITDERTGLLYKPGNYIQLSNKIEKLMDNSTLRNAIAENGKKFARKNFIKEKFGPEYNKIIIDLKKSDYQEKDSIRWFLAAQLKGLLAQKNREIQSLQEEIVALKLSKSWTLTRPLRKITALLKGIKNA